MTVHDDTFLGMSGEQITAAAAAGSLFAEEARANSCHRARSVTAATWAVPAPAPEQADDLLCEALRDVAQGLSRCWLRHSGDVHAWTSAHSVPRWNGEASEYDTHHEAHVTGVLVPCTDPTRAGALLYALSVLAWKIMDRDKDGDAPVEYARARLRELGLEMRSMREIERLGKSVKL